jgi:hypothetical protein
LTILDNVDDSIANVAWANDTPRTILLVFDTGSSLINEWVYLLLVLEVHHSFYCYWAPSLTCSCILVSVQSTCRIWSYHLSND